MSINKQLSFPTAEECDAYFGDLLPIERTHRKTAPQALMAADVRENGIDTGNDAEVNNDAPVIIAFADGVSEANREAVMLSVSFAEAVATGKADINLDAVKWLDEYAKAFRIGGWLTAGGHEYGEYTTSDTSATMDSVVLELISAVAGPNAQTVITLLNLVLGKLQKNEPMMKLFERNSKKGSTSTFRIMPCLESTTGIPVTYLLSMHCEYTSDSGGALFWKWSVSKLKIKRLAKGVNFDKYTHERNKQRILDYLGNDADEFFDGLK